MVDDYLVRCRKGDCRLACTVSVPKSRVHVINQRCIPSQQTVLCTAKKRYHIASTCKKLTNISDALRTDILEISIRKNFDESYSRLPTTNRQNSCYTCTDVVNFKSVSLSAQFTSVLVEDMVWERFLGLIIASLV